MALVFACALSLRLSNGLNRKSELSNSMARLSNSRLYVNLKNNMNERVETTGTDLLV